MNHFIWSTLLAFAVLLASCGSGGGDTPAAPAPGSVQEDFGGDGDTDGNTEGGDTDGDADDNIDGDTGGNTGGSASGDALLPGEFQVGEIIPTEVIANEPCLSTVDPNAIRILKWGDVVGGCISQGILEDQGPRKLGEFSVYFLSSMEDPERLGEFAGTGMIIAFVEGQIIELGYQYQFFGDTVAGTVRADLLYEEQDTAQAVVPNEIVFGPLNKESLIVTTLQGVSITPID